MGPGEPPRAFVLFERAPRLGGVIVTNTIDGYIIDAGPDALLTQKPAALALCRELGLVARLQPLDRPADLRRARPRRRELPEASVMGIPARWAPLATTTAFSWPGKLRWPRSSSFRRKRRTATNRLGRSSAGEAVD